MRVVLAVAVVAVLLSGSAQAADDRDATLQIDPHEAMDAVESFAAQMVRTAGDDPAWLPLRQIGNGVFSGADDRDCMGCNVFVGLGAGSGVADADIRRSILLGNCTAAPPHANGFVNIANKLCFWRDSGERVSCPPPETRCQK